MLSRLANHSFEPYGTFYSEPVDPAKKDLIRQEISVNTKRITQLYVFPCEVYIECPQGLARILVSDSPEQNNLRTFPVRDHIRLSPGIYFNLIPLSTPLSWQLITPQIQPQMVQLSAPYTYQPVSVPFHVRRILDCWFTDKQERCSFTRQINRSYELIYVYEGTMNTEANVRQLTTNKCTLIVNEDSSIEITIEGGNIYDKRLTISKEELTKTDDTSYNTSKDGNNYTFIFNNTYMH